MNTMRILICATFALLVAALVYFYVNDNKADDVTTEQLEARRNHLLLSKNVEGVNTEFTASMIPAGQPTLQEQLDAEEQKTLKEAEIKRLADEKELQILKEEAENTPKVPEVSNARKELIRTALVMAVVDTYSEEKRMAVIIMKRKLTIGQILSIRRNKTGIAGKVKVASFVEDKAIVDVIQGSFFGGPMDVQIGDELIFVR